jgi:hypothetical protein
VLVWLLLQRRAEVLAFDGDGERLKHKEHQTRPNREKI